MKLIIKTNVIKSDLKTKFTKFPIANQPEVSNYIFKKTYPWYVHISKYNDNWASNKPERVETEEWIVKSSLNRLNFFYISYNNFITLFLVYYSLV